MASYNKVIMMGNLTRDVELSYLPSQTSVAEFGLATNRRWKSKDGTEQEEICFVDCQAFGNQADTISKYFKKGDPILIEGRLKFDQWDAKDGTKRSKHRISVERFTFVQKDSTSQGGAERESSPSPASDQENIPF